MFPAPQPLLLPSAKPAGSYWRVRGAACYSERGESVRSRSLLLVDADPAIHELLGKVLKSQDRRINDVFDGHEALDRLRAAPCDVVFAGQGRNGFGGIHLLERVRAIRPETRVIVSGDANPESILKAIREQAY